MQKPNVVFVLTDDQGYPPLGSHGHPFIETPNLDDFFSRSTRFEQFHTGTTCAPTRAGLMTGHYCNSTGVWHTIGGRSLLRSNEWTLPDALGANGYATGLFGKWHLGDEYPYRPQDRGFQKTVCHGGGGISQQPDWWGNDYFNDTYMVDGRPEKFEGYCTDVFFDEAMNFIESNSHRPFFCYISTNAPHSPFNVEPHYRDLYLEEHTENENYARFLGMITNIDENFGRLRDKLKDLGIDNNTILIFMSDNGQTGTGCKEAYNAGMRGMKGSPYDGGHRVPFLMHWPAGGLHGADEINKLTSYIDFMPTILDLCDIDVPDGHSFHGESLVPLLEGQDSSRWDERTIVTDTQRVADPLKWRLSCVMKNKWRLVNRNELYDIEEDPGQVQNVADRHPSLVKKLQEAYEKWWEICKEQIDDSLPVSIGAEQQSTAVLLTHDLRTPDSDVVWNQRQVRQGRVCCGHWEFFAERDGNYEIALQRWPVEAGHKLRAGIEDGQDTEFRSDAVQPGSESFYRGGKALEVDTATLKITGHPRREIDIEQNDRAAVFRVHLERGEGRIEATLSGAGGEHLAPYYVYIRRID